MTTVDDTVHGRLLAADVASGPPAERAGLRALTRTAAPLLAGRAVERAVQRVEARIHGLGPLEPYVSDERVTEVMVNGGGGVWIEREGLLSRTELCLDEPEVLLLIERVVAPLGLHVDRASPIVDARLADGSRVHAIVRPLAVDGACLTIRRFGVRPISLRELCSPQVAELLRWIVGARLNIIVCGGAGAGKTTLLNALAGSIPDGDRVVTIEDAAELRLPGSHVVRLEARPPNAEGVGEVRVRDLVRTALRMRPDRIVVGEIRGGEAIDMLQAMNTGHDGSLSTCHANSPADALRRIETLVLMGDVELPLAAVRDQIAAALDVVVHVARDRHGGRRVTAVHEIARHGDGRVDTFALVAGDRVVVLPQRPPRAAWSAPPDSRWLET
jgi:pilus assembly protein CpaF